MSSFLLASRLLLTLDGNGNKLLPAPDWEVYSGVRFEESQGLAWLHAYHEDDREKLRSSFSIARENCWPFAFLLARLWSSEHRSYQRMCMCLASTQMPESPNEITGDAP